MFVVLCISKNIKAYYWSRGVHFSDNKKPRGHPRKYKEFDSKWTHLNVINTVRYFSFDISYFDTNLFITYDIIYKGGQFYSGLSEWTSFNYPYWILLNMIFEAYLVGKIFSIAWHLMEKYPLYPFVAWHFRIQIQNGGGGKNAFALKITVMATLGVCLYSTPLGHR